MGSTSVAISAEADSLLWNPSALSLTDYAVLSLSNSSFLGNTASTSAGIPSQEAGLSFGIPVNRLKTDKATHKNLGVLGFSSWLSGWNQDQEKDRIISGGYGVKLGGGFASGVAVKHHRRNRNDTTGIGWGLDLGTIYSRNARNTAGSMETLSLGASLENIGAKIRWDGGISQPLPLSIKVGSALSQEANTLIAADLVYQNDHKFKLQDRFRAHLGVERWFLKGKFGLRFGYTGITTYDKFIHGEWSRGVSLSSESGQIDYAYIKGSRIEPGRHWITATLRWGASSKPASPEADLVGDVDKFKGLELDHPDEPQLFSISDEIFSPNSDGKIDLIKFSFNLPTLIKASDWTLEIADSGGEVVKSISGLGAPPESYQWDGKDELGKVVADGVYTCSFMLINADTSREIPVSNISLTIDTKAPEVAVFADPLLISPESLQQSISALIHQSAHDQNGVGKWNLSIYSSDQKLVGSFFGELEPPNSVKWDGWQIGKREYHCVLSVEDRAGNTATSETKLFVVDTTGLSLRSEERGLIVSLPGSIFSREGQEIDKSAEDLIERTSYLIKSYQDSHVLLESYHENQKLSELRAKSLSSYLSSRHKIDAKRLISFGKLSNENRIDLVILSEEGESQFQAQLQAQLQKDALPPAVKGGYTVLAGSFKVRENAENLADALRFDVVEHEVKVQQIVLTTGVWYRVVVGRFSSEAEAQAIANAVSRLQGISCIVIRLPD